MTHRITGESIDVDFYDDEGEWFDGWFYCQYLSRARELAPPEQRLIELHRSNDTIMVSLDELTLTRFVIGSQENRAVFKLADDVVANAIPRRAAIECSFRPDQSRGNSRHSG